MIDSEGVFPLAAGARLCESWAARLDQRFSGQVGDRTSLTDPGREGIEND
jgi:hypothetical protein